VFVGCEVLLDTTSPDGSQRVTERRCKLNVEAPYLLKKVIAFNEGKMALSYSFFLS
jgi:hypothetical protein